MEPMDRHAQIAAFDRAIIAIEAAAPGFAMGGLQGLRARLKGLQRTSRTLFSQRLADDWIFHKGGRAELQFNLGLDRFEDQSAAFRAGVAFSFEPSRSLPDIGVLIPKVARFNAWMRENPEALTDMAMWHYEAGQRSDDYAPAPIPEARIRENTFVFLGHRQPVSAIDAKRALREMDRLLPLYEWIETESDLTVIVAEPRLPSDALRLGEGRVVDGGRWITATTRARTLDVFLRHAELQRRLRGELLAEGHIRVETEVPLGPCFIDVVAERADGLWFYEVKTASSVRACLREAIGQLLEYALWSGVDRPCRLIVVGEPPCDPAATRYLERLNAAFPIPIEYRQVTLS